MGSSFSQHNLQVLGDMSSVLASRLLTSLDWCSQTPACKGNLGIPRSQMPQIKSTDVPEFLIWLRASGVKTVRGSEAVGNLKATQREIDAEKVQKMAEAPETILTKPVIVSKDGHILDGHHRWAGLLTKGVGKKILTVHVDLPIRELLKKARAFPKAKKRDVGDIPVTATRDHGERQDEEAERLVRPAPKLKPPRRDRRREQVEPDSDPDTEERDPDESRNYKDIGGSVARRFAKRVKLITVRNKETGDPVRVSPEGLKKDPGKYEEIKPDEEKPAAKGKGKAKPEKEPKKKPTQKDDASAKKKPEGDEKKKEKPSEPTEAEKAEIPPPKQREASEAERMAANDLIMETFPPEIATQLLVKNMHPDDVADVVSSFHVSKSMPVGSDVGAFAEKAAKLYEIDPDRVKPPTKGVNAAGDVVSFDKLTPEEQAVAYRTHQSQVVGASLAAEEKLTTAFSMPSKKGEPQVPRELAAAMTTAVLGKAHPPATIEGPDGRDRDWADLTPEEQDSELKKANSERITTALQKAHAAALIADKPISDAVAKKLLSGASGDAAKVAKTFLMADDYEKAKGKFLGSSGMTEHSEPEEIADGLRDAAKFFKGRAATYGDEEHGSATAFRVKVLAKLQTLDAEKFEKVRGIFDREDAATYDKAAKGHAKAEKQWLKRKSDWEKAKKGGPFRGKPFEEPAPEKPRQPPRYHLSLKPAQAAKAGKRFFEDLMGRVGAGKTASRVAQKFVFTYSSGEAMAHVTNKTSVYHGIDPARNDPGPYVGWTQVHSRDIDEDSMIAILSSAKDWLKQPVLSREAAGLEDTRLRAALDLGLKSSGYDRHISPQLYDQLLARLAGKPEPSLDRTLTKLAGRSTSSCPPSQEVPRMKPSNEVRKLAAEAVETNPKLAYDLSDLADRMDAEPQSVPKAAAVVKDDRYGQLRSLVIRTAASDADAKKVLMPVLQAVKDLG